MGSPDGDKEAENDEKPQHKVRLSPFYLGVTEVTQEQYRAVTGNNPSWYSSTGQGDAQSPASRPIGYRWRMSRGSTRSDSATP